MRTSFTLAQVFCKVTSFLLACWGISFGAFSQESAVLDGYIGEGLAGNQQVKRQGLVVEQQHLAIKEARSLRLPTVGFGTLYTAAQGGRRIDLPIGDLLNPVYLTLNQLTSSQAFPQIANVSEQFFPRNFYDARFRTTMPLFNTDLRYNRLIREEVATAGEAALGAARRELVKDIKTGYFRYLQAKEAVGIFRQVLSLLAEMRRVNESLVKNGVATPLVISRTDSETEKMKARLQEAEGNLLNAGAYFNFLLHRAPATPILTDSALWQAPFPLSDGSQEGYNQREELQQIQAAINTAHLQGQLAKATRMPKVGAQLDLGSQGFDFEFNRQSRYALLGISIDIPLYTGGRTDLKVRQATKEAEALQATLAQTTAQLELQAVTAVNHYQSTLAQYRSVEAQLTAATRNLRDAQVLYKNGEILFIELLDAQTQFTSAMLERSISRLAVWAGWAEVERATAGWRSP